MHFLNRDDVPEEMSPGVHVLRRLLAPKSVAIVGGSADASKISGRPVKFLRRGGYQGRAYLINPSLPEVEGYLSLASVESLPEPPDAAFVALGAKAAIVAVRELALIGTSAAIVLASGYADGGPEGAEMQQELVLAAGKMRLLGPNSLGVINLSDGVMLSPSDALETPGLCAGSIGLASQSGGIMASLLSRATARGISFSKLISTGNEADLEISHCIDYLAEDDATSVIVLYLETLRRPQHFLAAAQHAREQGKRIVCYKVGRSSTGARAAVSHTGALAGSDRIYDAIFEQAGALRVSRFAELLAIPAALATKRRVAGPRVGVLTTTGGAGTLIADACGAAGMTLPPPDAALTKRVDELFPDGALDLNHNPIDLTLAGTRAEVMGPMIEELVTSTSFDAMIVIIGSSGVAQPRLVADPLIASSSKEQAKPIFVYASPHLPEVIQRLNRCGVPAFDAPEDCVAALAALADFPPTMLASSDNSAELAPDGQLLNEFDAKQLLARFGIHAPRSAWVRSLQDVAAAAMELAEPLALKILSVELVHKSDVGAVELGLSRQNVVEHAAAMLEKVKTALPKLVIDGFLLEEMHSGVEILLGMTRDPLLGPAILLGSGGTAAELFADTVVALPPIELALAEEMIERLRVAPLLHGARGYPLGDCAALALAVVAFSKLVLELSDALLQAEVNPLVVQEAGRGVLALDGFVRLAANAGDGARAAEKSRTLH